MQEAEKGATHILSSDKVLNETQAQAQYGTVFAVQKPGFPCTADWVLRETMVAHDDSWLIPAMAWERYGRMGHPIVLR